MRAPRTFGAYGVTLVLTLFGASGVMRSCTPPPPPPPPASAVSVEGCMAQVNVERSARGIALVGYDARLAVSAQNHSAYQASISTMTHNGPGGNTGGQRITAAGYVWRTWGENVAYGYVDCAAVMNGWMNSPGHQANILNPRFTNIGMGVAVGADGRLYWTMDLAAPR